MTNRFAGSLIQLVLLSSLVGACSKRPPSTVTLESTMVQEVSAPLLTAVPIQTPQVLATDTPTPVDTMVTPASSETPRLLFREDIPREAIIDQVAWAPGCGGGGSCAPSCEPFSAWPEEATVGTVVYFCHCGLSPGEVIEITVTDPGGRAHQFTRQANEAYGVDLIWSVWLDDPLGRYSVFAQTDSGSVYATFEAKPAVDPVVLINPHNATLVEYGEYYYWQPGDTLDVMYAGFEPDEVVEVVMLFSPCQWAGIDETAERFAAWQVRMDRMGQAFERLQVPNDWPEGHYSMMAFGKQQTRCSPWVEFVADGRRDYQCSAYDMFFLGDPAGMGSCFESDITMYAAVQASSVFPPERRHSYEPQKATDGITSTTWVEGVSGPGIGEWIELAFPQEAEIWQIGLNVGFDESEFLFYANNRIWKACLCFSDDAPIEMTAQDVRGIQYFRIPFVRTTLVRLEILDVYPGTRWDDTCLAEIVIWGRFSSQ